MNFEEYTLVAFGDSFTYGMCSHPDNLTLGNKTSEELKAAANKWSYPSYVGKNLNFKNVINLGHPGIGNFANIGEVVSFHEAHKNDNEKYFYMVNLSVTYRSMMFSNKMDRNDKIDPGVYIMVNTRNFDNQEVKELQQKSIVMKKIKKQTFQEYHGFTSNDLTDIHNTFLNTIMLLNYLESTGVPYQVHDLLNNALGLLEVLERNQQKPIRQQIDFDHNPYLNPSSFFFIEWFVDNLPNYTKYLNRYNINNYVDSSVFPELGEDQISKLHTLVYSPYGFPKYYGKVVHDDELYFHKENQGDPHWDYKGQELFAKLISKHIREQYKGE